MRRVSIASLKAKLSEYLVAVRAGEEVIVTDRGRPVARLGPVGAEGQEERLRDLYRSGLARPPLKKLPADFWDLPRPADPQGRALAALLEDRREGR